jgi:hypothetical protein
VTPSTPAHRTTPCRHTAGAGHDSCGDAARAQCPSLVHTARLAAAACRFGCVVSVLGLACMRC